MYLPAQHEVSDITTGFLNMTRRAIGVEHTMTGDHYSGMQALDLIQCAEPLAASFYTAFREVGVSVVIDGIAGYDQADGRHMQSRGMRGVGMVKFDYLRLFAFKVERISVDDLRQTNCEGSWPGKRGSQKELMNPGLIWCCIPATADAVANALALGKRSSSSFRPRKWSPCACVM